MMLINRLKNKCMKYSYKSLLKENARLFYLSANKIASIFMLISFALTSCNRDEVFEREQYKNVFALISAEDNVSNNFHELGVETIGYVAASLGGTKPTTKDIIINLVEDKSLIDKFNKSNFDVDATKYYRYLPTKYYDIDNYQFVIHANEISGKLPIRIRTEGLSPDSSYMIALRIESHSAYESNPDKNYILYRIRTQNNWAKSDGTTTYNLLAKRNESGTTVSLTGSKVMHPVSKNKVRIMAGDMIYEPNINVFNKSAIILEILENNKVQISSYKNLEITQIDGDVYYSNIYKIVNDGYKTYKVFLIRYNYVSEGKTYEMSEELKLEFKQDAIFTNLVYQ